VDDAEPLDETKFRLAPVVIHHPLSIIPLKTPQDVSPGADIRNAGGIIVANQNALSAYKETKIKTAGQGHLIVMLYDGAIRSLDSGLELLGAGAGGSGKIDPGSIERVNKAILKAQEIITELQVSLDFEKGGEIAKNLFSLYAWFNQELLTAGISRDIHKVTVVRNMLNELRGAWGGIASRPAESEGQRGGLNIEG
jgi:flagellar protein FliS